MYHLQLRYYPPIFCKIKWPNIKFATSHDPVFQKEVDEVFVEGVIEPLTGGARFYSNVFVFLGVLLVYDLYAVLGDLITT